MSRIIVVADESSETRSVIATTLRRWGHAVLEASDGRTLREACGQPNVGLILLSATLLNGGPPDIGWQVRSGWGNPAAPVVLLSETMDESVRARGQEAGVAGLLQKPVLLSELAQCLLKYSSLRPTAPLI